MTVRIETATEVRALAEPVVNITSMSESAEEERQSRTRRYLLMMAIRTICLMLMVFVRGPWLWAVAAVAIFMPWIAVVLANHVRQRRMSQMRSPNDSALVVYRPPVSEQDWLINHDSDTTTTNHSTSSARTHS